MSEPTIEETLRAELEQARREADVRIALEPMPHQHSFCYSSTGTTPMPIPSDVACACGVTCAEASEIAALRARVEELERMGNELVTFMGKDASPTSAWKEFVEVFAPPPPRASELEGA